MMNNTKRLIFESALKVFSECGYSGAIMDDIAFRAGVAKGTLYYHFKSKEEIFKFAITEGMNLIKEQIEAVTFIEENPIEKLKALCKVELSLVYDNKDFFKVIMSQLWGEEARQLELRETIHNHIEYLENFIQPAMDGDFIKKGDASFIAYTIFGTLCSAAIYELLHTDKAKSDDVIENLMNYILNGIGV